MAITVKHKFVSAIPDAGDTTIVQPSNWNDDHQLSGTVPVANGGTGASTLTGYVKGNGTSAMTATTTVPNTDVTGLGTASTKDAGVANGVATLDSSGQVPLSQIPPLGDLNYQGTWNATTNSPTLTSSVGTKGFYYVVSVAGTTNLNGITDWQIGDWAVFNGSVWQKIDNTDAVTSVNGYTGTVVLTAADVSAIPYTGATGAVDLNAKTLVNVSNLGVNTTTVPTIKIRAVGDNNSSSRIAMRGYSSDANSSAIRVSKFRGTVAAPQAPISGDSLGKFELAGYGTTSADAYPQVSLEGVTTEVWGATARGAKAVVKVTPNTTITQVTALTIDQDSKATFANTVTANGVLLTGNTGTVTSVAATAGTGISVSGSPITTSGTLTITNTAPDQTVAISAGTGISTSGTYPNFTVTNTAPDQTVALTAGTGISTSGTYPNFTITNTSPSSGGTVTSVTGTAPVVSSGGNTPAISMAAANTTTNGYLTSTDWNTFNNKSNTNGTVTSVAALTLGTTGTDLSSTVANGTTTPVITLQVPTASATNRGALSAADWTTFNNKTSNTGTVTSVAATVPSFLSVSGSPITTSGTLALTYSGTALPTANGGTGLTSFTANGVVYASSTSALATSSALIFDGTNLGVGATPLSLLYLKGTDNQLVISSASNRGLEIGTDGTTGTILSYDRGAASYKALGYNALSHLFSASGSASVRINAYGVGLGNTTPSSGTGVSFPATQSASTDVNTLDDYEEGTWTVTDTSGASLSITNNSVAQYVKVGKLIYAFFDVTYPTTADVSTADLSLPFVSYAGYTGGYCVSTSFGTVISAQNRITAARTNFINTATGTALTNVNLSGKRLSMTIMYITST